MASGLMFAGVRVERGAFGGAEFSEEDVLVGVKN
jgi:hypothetical protein